MIIVLKKLKQILRKPTIFLLFGAIYLLIGIPFTIWISFQPEISLVTSFLILVNLVTLGLLIADRFVVRKFNPKYLSIIEFFLLAALFGGVQFENRKIKIDVKDLKEDYLIAFIVEEQSVQSDFKWSFPFNKRIVADGNCILVSKDLKSQYEIELINNDNWTGGLSAGIENFEGSEYFTFWAKNDFHLKIPFDSLVIQTYNKHWPPLKL